MITLLWNIATLDSCVIYRHNSFMSSPLVKSCTWGQVGEVTEEAFCALLGDKGQRRLRRNCKYKTHLEHFYKTL